MCLFGISYDTWKKVCGMYFTLGTGSQKAYLPVSYTHLIAIVRANRYVVDHVDYLISYAWHPASNARELVEYARKRQRNLCISITLIKPDD